jgi:hypothetical protein
VANSRLTPFPENPAPLTLRRVLPPAQPRIIHVSVVVKVTSPPARPVASESQASSVVVRQVTSIPAAVLTRVSPGQEITPLQTVKTSGPQLAIGGKPAIVFVSG